MDTLGSNRRIHLEYILGKTYSERKMCDRALETAENTWRNISDISRAKPDDRNAAALADSAHEILRATSIASVETKMLQGEIEEELFASGEEADDWYKSHQ